MECQGTSSSPNNLEKNKEQTTFSFLNVHAASHLQEFVLRFQNTIPASFLIQSSALGSSFNLVLEKSFLTPKSRLDTLPIYSPIAQGFQPSQQLPYSIKILCLLYHVLPYPVSFLRTGTVFIRCTISISSINQAKCQALIGQSPN